jgi:hypothetical protein
MRYDITMCKAQAHCTHWNDMLLTQILLTCRAVPPCRSETTRETPGALHALE